MSSYIAFDLDALNVVPDVALASGIPAGDVAHGLLKLWAWCFRNKTDTVTELHLAGFFGKPAAPSLATFGFLEASGASWRVKGAERYLRVAEGRRRGGLNAKANLVPGGRKPASAGARVEPRASREPAEAEARLDLGLSPTTEHRTPNTDDQEKTAPASRAPRETDLLCEDFKEVIGKAYVWADAKDGTAFAKLKRTETIEEIRARWKAGLKSDDKWRSVRTIAQLASKWNDLAPSRGSSDVMASAAQTTIEITNGF